MSGHPEGAQPGIDKRAAKEERVRPSCAHTALVFDAGGVAQGWARYGRSGELPGIAHRRADNEDPPPRPDWRISCFYVDKRHRGQSIARAALEGALAQIAAAGGGTVESIPEVTAGRTAHGRFLFNATVELFEDYGFERVRQLGKWTWLVRSVVPAA
ncbi:MAG: GNAT family N-acetyltransferase [Mycobacteriales bacterium]